MTRFARRIHLKDKLAWNAPQGLLFVNAITDKGQHLTTLPTARAVPISLCPCSCLHPGFATHSSSPKQGLFDLSKHGPLGISVWLDPYYSWEELKLKKNEKRQKGISIFLSLLGNKLFPFYMISELLKLTNKHKLSSQTEEDQVPFWSTDRII